MTPPPHPPRYTADEHIPGAFDGEAVTRRRFMSAGAGAMGAIAAAGITLPVLGFAVAPVFQHTEATWRDVGPVGGFGNDFTRVVVTISPDIGDAGNSLAYIRRRIAGVDTEPEDQWNRFITLSSRCAHVGCPVNYVTAAASFVCPCHGGVYDFRGVRTGGPPPRPLDRFYNRVVDGRLQVGPRYSVNSELRRFSLRDPGEPLDGIGQYLYPARPSTPRL